MTVGRFNQANDGAAKVDLPHPDSPTTPNVSPSSGEELHHRRL